MTWLVETFLFKLTYLALILLLILAGMGAPVPEDIPLIYSGYLCSKHSPIGVVPMIDTDGDGVPDSPDPHHPPRTVPKRSLMMVAGMIGVLLGDSIVFSIGRRGIDADNFVARHLRKVMHSKRREKVERHFAKHGNLTVFAARFMPGFRSIVFAFAGMAKMSYLRFLIIDGLAALISVPLFVMMGWYFADVIHQFFKQLDRFKYEVVFPMMLVVAVGAAVIYLVRRRRAAVIPVDGV